MPSAYALIKNDVVVGVFEEIDSDLFFKTLRVEMIMLWREMGRPDPVPEGAPWLWTDEPNPKHQVEWVVQWGGGIMPAMIQKVPLFNGSSPRWPKELVVFRLHCAKKRGKQNHVGLVGVYGTLEMAKREARGMFAIKKGKWTKRVGPWMDMQWFAEGRDNEKLWDEVQFRITQEVVKMSPCRGTALTTPVFMRV